MGRPVALLDVDHTLLFNERLNFELLRALKQNDIQDVYLFTDMTLKSYSVHERNDLIDHLKQLGFKVHGVLTPLDLLWHEIPADRCQEFIDYTLEHGPSKWNGSRFKAFLNEDECPREFQFARRAISKSKSHHVELGVAFNEGCVAFQEVKELDDKLPNHLEQKSTVAKVLGDQLAVEHGYEHSKGLILSEFVKRMPNWVSSIVIADDNTQVISSIAQYIEFNRPTTSITAIHITDEHTDESEYYQTIKEHICGDTTFSDIKQMCEMIDQHIQAFNTCRLFFTSADPKVSVLNILKTRLKNADLSNQSIDDVISNWLKESHYMFQRNGVSINNERLIAMHRNIFKPTFNNHLTPSQELISTLRANYGHITMQADSLKVEVETELTLK